MKPFSPSFLVHSPDDDSTVFKFCGQECRDFFLLHPLTENPIIFSAPTSVPLKWNVHTYRKGNGVDCSFEVCYLGKTVKSG